MTATLRDINGVGRCEPCGGKRPPCQLCSNMKNTSTSKSKNSNEVYQIKKNFNCNSKMVVYLIECRVCGKQYNGSTVTKFRARANNYKRTHRNFRKEQILSNQVCNQKRFHEHSCTFSRSEYPASLKYVDITPIFKKDDKTDKTNHRPIRIPPNLSKIYEQFMQNQLYPYLNQILSKY